MIEENRITEEAQRLLLAITRPGSTTDYSTAKQKSQAATAAVAAHCANQKKLGASRAADTAVSIPPSLSPT